MKILILFSGKAQKKECKSFSRIFYSEMPETALPTNILHSDTKSQLLQHKSNEITEILPKHLTPTKLNQSDCFTEYSTSEEKTLKIKDSNIKQMQQSENMIHLCYEYVIYNQEKELRKLEILEDFKKSDSNFGFHMDTDLRKNIQRDFLLTEKDKVENCIVVFNNLSLDNIEKIYYPLNFFNKIIKDISCSKNHTIFQTTDGIVFVLGNNESGQLGIENQIKNDPLNEDLNTNLKAKFIKEPFMVTCLFSYHITKVFAGDESSCALGHKTSYFNKLEFQIWGDTGYLGTKYKQHIKNPITHPFFVNKNIQNAVFGFRHNFICASNNIYAFGSNSYGQLGFGKINVNCWTEEGFNIRSLNTNNWVFIKDKSKDIGSIWDIQIGDNCSFFYTTKNYIFACGLNTCFRLGIQSQKKIIYDPQEQIISDKLFESKLNKDIESNISMTIKTSIDSALQILCYYEKEQIPGNQLNISAVSGQDSESNTKRTNNSSEKDPKIRNSVAYNDSTIIELNSHDMSWNFYQQQWFETNYASFVEGCKTWTLNSYVASGIPDAMKKKLWMQNLDKNLGLTEKVYNIFLNQGLKYISHNTKAEQGFFMSMYQGSSIRTIFDIEQDITRTKNAHPEDFQDGIEVSIKNVLLAWTQYRPDIGYIQGMIPALVYIRRIFNEYETWKMFCLLALSDHIFPMQNYDQINVDQMSEGFDKMFQQKLPKLYDHFQNIGLDNRIYLLKWFQSFFVECFTYTQWRIIMDFIVFCKDDKFYRIAILILKLLRDQQKGMDLAQSIKLLKERQSLRKVDESKQVGELFNLDI